jgi:DNA-binding transcriptional LysR family regulator
MKNADDIVLDMGNIDLTALEIFKTVAEQGGITKAATRLNRVQSNVTTRVKQLEERLGTQLFLRQNRKLLLSPQGKLLLAYAQRLLHLSSEAEAALCNGTPAGPLQIGALESTAATRLPPILSRYHQMHPDVRIELVTGTTGALLAKLLKHDIEAAFVAEPFTPHELEMQPVFREDLVLITPKSFKAFKGPKHIGRTTIIAFSTGCSYRRRLEDWLGRAKVVPDRILDFASYHAIMACVAAGVGIAIVPRSVMRISPARHAVKAYRLPPAVAAARTCLVWRRDHHSVALDALRAELPSLEEQKTRALR